MDSPKNADNCRFAELLAVAVASGFTVRDSAANIGCSERTAYGISGTPEFKLRVAELRTAIVDTAVGKISDATTRAVDTLVTLLDDDKQALGAAKAILSNVGPLSQLGEIRDRLDKLEQR